MLRNPVMRYLILLTCLMVATGCVRVTAERHAEQQRSSLQAPVPAPDAAMVNTIAAVMAGTQPMTATYVAPDGLWQAEIVRYGCVATSDDETHAYEMLRLARINSSERQQMDSQLINCGGLGAYGLEGLCWSPDGRYFYYGTAREGAPDGYGNWTPPIWQLDIKSGMIRKLDAATPATDMQKDLLCASALP